MANVVLAWTTVGTPFPVSTDLSQYRVRIDGQPDQFVAFGTTSYTFPDVAPGDNYIARVALSNADGSHVENDKSVTFSIPVPSVTLQAPDVVNVSIS